MKLKYQTRRKGIAFFLFYSLLGLTGCKKLVEVDAPITSINSANVYATDATAIAAVTGIYTNISGQGIPSGGITSVSVFSGLSGDELTLFNGATSPAEAGFYTNALSNTNPGSTYFWSNYYTYIYEANSSIAGISASTTLTPAVKQDLLGECYFMRAFCLFYLTNLYGDVPVPLTTDYKTNALLPRTASKLVYQQIVGDLLQAQKLLPKTYTDATVLKTTNERIRPNYWTATALLARTYLYTADYKDAIAQSSALISNSALFSLSSLSNVFLRASSGNNEAIWQLQSVGAGNSNNTPDALAFILPASGPSGGTYSFYLSNFLLNSFEPGDQRLVNWVNSVTANGTTYYYPFKYKVNNITAAATEYEIVFRLAEQYLIRAEAEAENSDPADAVNDLNVIRNRAGLANYAGATDQASLITAILHERQVEFFTEWGHRWLDLKRSGTINAVMGSPGNVCSAKGGAWNNDWALYPVSLSELKTDPNLTQNPGY